METLLRYEALSVTGNNLLVSMCSHVTKEREIAESAVNGCSSVVKSTLQTALPSMNCESDVSSIWRFHWARLIRF